MKPGPSGQPSGAASRSAAGGLPGSGQVHLTAGSSSAAGVWLAGLGVGDRVTLALAPAGTVQRGTAQVPIGKPSGLLGISSIVLAAGVNQATCGSHDEVLRPRTAIRWKRNGDVVIAAISGRDVRYGIRYGGASVHQWAEYLRKLGVVDAAIFDGRNATNLLVRTAVGGRFYRLDRTSGDLLQRPVTDALAFRA